MTRSALSRRGSCVPAAIEMLPGLIEGRDFIVEGKVRFTSRKWEKHTWMEIDGEVYDPSILQFSHFKGYPRVEYSVERRLGINEFRAIWQVVAGKGSCLRAFWQDRLQSFGVNPHIHTNI